MTDRTIFMSYSWKDMAVASRLYDDLVRSGLSVWRDQVDGDPTDNFLEEFLSKIDECDDFLLLDSRNFRNKSNWCLTELERCFSNRTSRGGPRVIVCLLDEDGQWRTQFKSPREEKVYSVINMFKYHRLYYPTLYDNGNIYLSAVQDICSLFDRVYTPWDELPATRDLDEELLAARVPMGDEYKGLILDEYKNILRLIRTGRNPDKHFSLWIEDCAAIAPKLFFPLWTYSIWLGQSQHNGRHDDKCLELFSSLVRTHPLDPRGYRGLGCILSRFRRYNEAADVLKSALDLLKMPQNGHHKEMTELEILQNLGQTLINAGDLPSASVYLNQGIELLLRKGLRNLSLVLNYNSCLVSQGKYNDSLCFLRSITDEYILDAEFNSALGLTHTALEQDYEAVSYLANAYTLSPTAENGFLLMSNRYARLKIDQSMETFLQNILSAADVAMDDSYWKGAICFYLLGDSQMARNYYERNPSLGPWYEKNG